VQQQACEWKYTQANTGGTNKLILCQREGLNCEAKQMLYTAYSA